MRIYRSGELVQTRTVAAPTTTHTETGLGWGMYTVAVAAVNANGAAGDEATTGDLTVGVPGKLAAAPATTTGIGSMALAWVAPTDDPAPAATAFFAKVGWAAAGLMLVNGAPPFNAEGCCPRLPWAAGARLKCVDLAAPLPHPPRAYCRCTAPLTTPL